MATKHDIQFNTIAEHSKALANGDYTSVELTQYYLDRIKSLDKQLNSFITVCSEQAIEQAKAADKLIAAGKATKLTGIPFAQKDIFCTNGIKTSCGSKILDNFIAPYDATVVEKMRAAGMVMLGKTNMDEFAMGSSNENSYYGPVHNPWDLDCIPGGSSGGSAAAVAARIAPAATGTDTGGSIRQPAALCGITGLKPTYGRISRYGMIAFASSLDQAGPMTQTAEDAAMLLEVMAGHDPRDSTSLPDAVPEYTKELNKPIKGCKIGLPKEYFENNLSAETSKLLNDAIDKLKTLGAEFVEISLPNTHLAPPVYYIIAPAEASANLSRYDGVRYGHRCENPTDLDDLYCRSRSEGFGDEVKRRILTGNYVLSSGFYDAYYIRAQTIRRLIRDDFLLAFKDVDLILAPTTPTPAFKIGEKNSDPVTMYMNDIFTIAVNLAGLPGISIPVGSTNGKPMGMQLIGPHLGEAKCLNVAHQFQQNDDSHKQTPAFAQQHGEK